MVSRLVMMIFRADKFRAECSVATGVGYAQDGQELDGGIKDVMTVMVAVESMKYWYCR